MNIGTELRQAREARALSIAALAAATRIPSRTIEAIERHALPAIPPRPYGRGFVAAYAREVGLDPERTARAYFAQFESSPAGVTRAGATTPSAGDRRTWRPAAVTLVALALLLAIFVWPARIDRAEPGAVGTSGMAAAGSGPVTHLAAQGQEAIVVVLDADARAWVSASADGRRVLYRLLQPGERETLQASRELTLRVGDAGALRWSVNGRPAEPMGRAGEVRTVTLRRD